MQRRKPRTSSRTRVSVTGAATACKPEPQTIHITDNHTKNQSSRSSWRTTVLCDWSSICTISSTEGRRQARQVSLCVSLLLPVDEIPVSYVATHEIDDRPVHDHKTGERLAPQLVKVGRQTECEAMNRHQLFERVPITLAHVGSRQEGQMSIAGRDERRSRWTIRAKQARCDGSGPRNPI